MKRSVVIESVSYVVICLIMSLLLHYVNAFELLYDVSRAHEDWNLDEFVLILPSVMFVVLVYAVRRTSDLSNEIKARKFAEERIQMELDLKNEFMTVVSHEMRTPINGVIGLLDAIRYAQDEGSRQEFHDLAVDAAQSLYRQLDDVMTFARIDHGQLVLHEEEVSPASILERVKRNLHFRAEDKGIAIHCLVDTDTPEVVISHNGPLNQIVMNLAENALKFTSEGSISLQVSMIQSDLAHSSPHLQFVIADTGSGIDPTHLEDIFEPYYQVSQEGTTRHQGLGFGLSLVKKLVHLLEGTIQVKSEIGQGSTFIVTVPVVLKPEQ